MSKKIIVAFIAISLSIAIYFLKTPDANCWYCPTYACFSRCNDYCACVTMGGEWGGTCVSVQAVPHYKSKGYQELK